MGEQRTCVMTSKHLSADLGISRDAARERLKALASVTIAGSPLLTVEMTRSHTYWPGQYHISFSPLVPVTCGGGEVRDELWVKHFDEARALAKQLSPEAYVTLLALAIDMTETRTLRVPFQALAKRLGVSPSNAQKRITELCQTGVIRKLANPAGNEYYISDVVPLMFGAEDDPENWELEPQEIKLADITRLERLTCLDPHIKRRKELKEEKTTTPQVVENSSENTDSVVGNPTANRKPTEPDLSQVVTGEKSSVSGAQKAAMNGETLPFAAQVGSKNSRQWVERFGLDRCQEVWDKAQSARNAGGYMRKALEENWMWPESGKRTGVREWRYWDVSAEERAATAEKLLGIKLDLSGPIVDRDKVLAEIPDLRRKLRG